ncbi:Tat-linked quality control protein TatD [Candidatus Bilamarchaeum dharawalense]|uniref:Tat-linked quality control protein TatD n=1 Tax=Candidatus Bilamarchaeum dharawalense TaxID=2885759 RepID=A0A5E4LTX9_9ARCH|nr:Tat-linked quality control protein TatD [Candidatus Bilamarchaeum dharawalense]
MILIDSHTHLFEMKKDYLLPADIYPVVAGYSHGANKKATTFAKEHGYPFILGIAPQSTVKEGISKLDEWVGFIRQNKPNAIGEVGLDYKWAETRQQADNEKIVFQKMIELAKEMKLPLVIHSRNNPVENDVPKDAVEDILAMATGMKLLMHFYSGSEEQAMRIVENGGYISIMHLRSKERRKVINSVPLNRLLVESDSPYVGRTPESIREAIAYIAEVKNVGTAVVAKATSENAMKFFNFHLE